MNALLVTLTAAALISATPGEAKKQNEKSKPVRVLLVTGVDYKGHRWKETAPALKEVLEKDKRMAVRIVEDPDFLSKDEVFDYDVVFLHFKNYKPLAHQDKAQANLKKFVEQGGGLVAFHFACGAFEDWPEYSDLIGKVWDKKLGHDPRRPFTVNIVDKKHAITGAMKDFQADDELYFCLTDDREVKVLATARSVKTGKDHPMAFVFDYGKGRVFHTPLGHDVKAIQMAGVAELTRRGCIWAAGKQP